MVKYRDIYESVKTTSRCHKHFLKFLLENPVMDPKQFRKAFLHIYMELVAKEPVENLRRIRALPEDGLTVLLKELMKKMNELAGGLGLKLSQIDFESASPFTAPETCIVLYSTRPMNPGLIAAGEWTHDELYLMHHFVELLRDSPDHQMFYARAEDIGRSLPNKMSIEKIHELIDGLINSGWLDITANEEIFLGRRAAIELEPVLLGQGPGGGWNACAACRRVVYTKLVWKCSTCGDLCHPFCYRRYAKTMREAGAKHIQCPTVAKGCTAVYHIDDRDGTENLFCAGRPCRDEKMDEKKEDTDSDDDEDDEDEEVKEEEEDEAMDEN